MLDKLFLLNVEITNATEKEILEYVVKNLEKLKKNYYVVTPNPEFLVFANKKQWFKNILNKAEIALNDGVGLSIAARALGKELSERTTGVDFMEKLCKEVSKEPITVGFLGGREGIAERTAECLREKFPGLHVVFAGSEWGDGGFVRQNMYQVSSIKYQAKDEKAKILNTKYKIHNTEQIDLLFVAFGFPKQEEWMAKHQSSNIYKVAVGVGGAFDYISGVVPRAPGFVQVTGFEWLFRLLVQPWRWRRQLALLEFLLLVGKEKLT